MTRGCWNSIKLLVGAGIQRGMKRGRQQHDGRLLLPTIHRLNKEPPCCKEIFFMLENKSFTAALNPLNWLLALGTGAQTEIHAVQEIYTFQWGNDYGQRTIGDPPDE
jgi:hypothetical protein